ncbi:MAG: GAF domain-containing sensor histidine kinase [Nannocystaceae bacterium]|nr:GAF domain-containing sensor histidine kinase [Myxococcales bacterium]
MDAVAGPGSCDRRDRCSLAPLLEQDPALGAYRRIYCEQHSDQCARYIALGANQIPADRLLPDGRRLPDPAREAEDYARARGIAPIPPDEPRRLAALRRHELLDTPPEASFDEITALASELCETPIALVSLIDAERQWFKSRVGLDAEETPRDQAFCGHAILGDEPFVVPDATRDPRFARNPLVTGPPDIRFYAGAPLVTGDGYRIGTLCVIDRIPRSLTPTQLRVLKVLGKQVVAQLRLRSSVEELRRRNRELTRTRKDMERTLLEVLNSDREEQSRRAFLSHVTHELRTPLNAIIGLSELVREEAGDDDPHARDLDLIHQAGRHMLALVHGLLDMASIESGVNTVASEEVDIVALVETVLALLRPAAARGNNTLETHVSADAATLQTDPLKLRQILFNLLGNACNYTQDGVVRLRVTAAPGAGSTRFEITDTGVGMTAEQLARLFDRFSRFTQSHVRATAGSGLGMTITRMLIEQLGGTIQVESSVGVGTRFCVDLPSAAPAT